MIVVSDTTPLNYLVLIEAVDVLPALFQEVYAPPEVLRELLDEHAPQSVSAWAARPPEWLKVVVPSTRLLSTARLGPGEADAISLAKQINAQAVLLDDMQGRRIALAEGLFVVRTLALLELAAEKRLIHLRQALDRLQATTFRIRQDYVDAALARDAARRAIDGERNA